MTDTPTPPLTGIDIGVAAQATRALLDELLVAAETTFPEWVTLRTVALAPAPPARDALRHDLASALRVDEGEIETTLAGLARKGLLTGSVELTADGTARFDRLQAGVQRITAELYGEFDPADLAVAGRVLRQVAERATARLAG
jgi:hypothetical protein